MHRRLASQWRPGDLTAAIGYDFVHIHVELRTAACHPHVQREHVVMLPCENFVASLRDQFVLLLAESLAVMVCCCCGLLQGGIGGDHLARNEILADTEMFQPALPFTPP